MKALVEMLIGVIFKSIGVFHSPKTIYFESFHGTQYSDNPKALYEWLKQTYPQYKLVWGVNKGQEKPFRDEKVSYVLRFSIKWFLTMPRAAVWVINTRTPLWLKKSPKTVYLQTWHGTPLKKLGQDIEKVNIPGYTKESYDLSFSEESERWDYLVSPNAYSSEIFKRAFAYHGKILETGYPRNDQLVNFQNDLKEINKIKETLDLPINKKLILYAPTWREKENRVNGRYQFSIDFPFEELVTELGKDGVLLVRMHYLVAQQFDFSQYKGKIINVSEQIDMADLLLISDLLITDYSSCMFDYSITNKPMIFYIPDQTEYENELRGFYFPMETQMPGNLITNKEDLIELIKKWQITSESLKTANYDIFKKEFASSEKGNASKTIMMSILDEEVK